MSIRFENVSKSFGAKVILKNVSFEVQRGEILFILGKSGMGKSVTLKHIIGVLKPDSGRVFVDLAEVSQLDNERLADIRKHCGMVFQHPALLDSLSVLENVGFGIRDRSPDVIRKIVLEKLKLVHLGEELIERFPPSLSYGMQKRVSLARTLAPAPEYLLFDEPTTGLDPITTNAINALILELSRELKVTSIVVSHDMRCALAIADRILVLDQGGIRALGTVEEIKKSRDELVRDFLSEVSP
jgi:phospholipid/cholesterol/gamma-HCH transport system ATP-binding protein